MRVGMSRLALAGALVAPAAGIGCGGDVSTGTGGSATTTTTTNVLCVPGTQIECACPGGEKGAQRCAADGSGYGACEGCGGTGGSTSTGSTGGTGGTGGTPPGNATKLDLLLDIDNSRSMADKQGLLAADLSYLVGRLVNPLCVDPNTGVPSAQQPSGPADPCPDAATKREFAPLADIHIGVITSSLGGHGSDACPTSETYSCPGKTNATNNDAGHLITRLDPCTGGTVSTYQGKGFLAWDPKGMLTPPGEASAGSVDVDTTTGVITTVSPGLAGSLKDLALGAGQVGCGYESQLESWYRFLVDPEPYQTISIDPITLRAQPEGTDAVLLQQRKDFLRPNSVLAIVVLSDENDCSIREYGQYYFAAQQRDPSNPNKNFYLPRARSECATNPSDPCCRSCGQDQAGCPVDPACSNPSLDAQTDNVSLRCWDQKRRFGIDFLYPIDRYVTALTQPLVPNRLGEMVPNPIFSDLDPNDGNASVRSAADVFFTGIVGVPWQDLARDPLDLKKGFKSAAELLSPNAQGKTTWDYVIGDPANYVPPSDPHMIESTKPRSGTNPYTGDVIAPASSAPGPGPNKINGHEYTPGTINGVQTAPNDLQYACIFPLWQPRDCSASGLTSCDCTDPKNDNPLCEPQDPSDPLSFRTKQVRAKGYPGIRELALVKALGAQGVPGSICPAQITDVTKPDFAYRPAFASLVERLRTRLAP